MLLRLLRLWILTLRWHSHVNHVDVIVVVVQIALWQLSSWINENGDLMFKSETTVAARFIAATTAAATTRKT